MSVNIGKIAAVVSASDQSFTSTMRRVERATVQTYSRVDAIAKRLTGSIGGMLGGLAVGATVYQSIERLGAALERLDNAGDAAEALGLRTEFLMGIQYDARFAGIELDKLIVRMRATIAEAAAGSRQDRSVLEALGLDPDSLARLGTEQQLLAIADAMKAVRDQGERLRLSGAIFGGKGVERAAVANFLGRGSGALMSGVQRAQNIGVAMTGGDVAAASAASDAIDNAKLAVQGLENVLTVKTAPAIETIGNALQDHIVALQESTGTQQVLSDGLIDVVGVVGTGLQAFGRGVRAFGSLFQNTEDFMKSGNQMLDEWGSTPTFGERLASSKFMQNAQAARRKQEAARRQEAMKDVVTLNPQIELEGRLEQHLSRQLEARATKIAAINAERQEELRLAEELEAVQQESLAMQVAENVLAEQDRMAEEAQTRLDRIAEIERQSPGGTRAIVAGSNEARIAQFNASFQQQQTSVQQRQLSTQELIKKSIDDQRASVKRMEEMIRDVLATLQTS